MSGHPVRQRGLSAEEAADWQECQSDHSGLMAQLADREAQMETGLIDDYDAYQFTWDEEDPIPSQLSAQPPAPSAAARLHATTRPGLPTDDGSEPPS
ncbi:hypothetical protein BGK67_00115 [Streptomyces subrutilus]|uniref:Uncharacterized protein n=1 Tax=Streptomyces subrutilus TaxID=36818 RepID=A0A1E5PKB6_9ACTN|nr:hypothetical protein BGK67_00115 [Streptomyces subrutilus]